MQPLLGLIFFSLLLTTGTGLQCEICIAMGDTCSSNKTTCPSNADGCISVVTANKTGETEMKIAMKSCSMMSECRKFKSKVENVISQVMGIQGGALIIDVECSKAPICFASLLLTVSGLLLMKFLF